tara:strand:+ start:675 stop:824 length:150 start_codon:yes stop_codon:yes gene_type:complete
MKLTVISLATFFLFSCNYPNINDIPTDMDLDVTFEDISNIKKLKSEINE